MLLCCSAAVAAAQGQARLGAEAALFGHPQRYTTQIYSLYCCRTTWLSTSSKNDRNAWDEVFALALRSTPLSTIQPITRTTLVWLGCPFVAHKKKGAKLSNNTDVAAGDQ